MIQDSIINAPQVNLGLLAELQALGTSNIISADFVNLGFITLQQGNHLLINGTFEQTATGRMNTSLLVPNDAPLITVLGQATITGQLEYSLTTEPTNETTYCIHLSYRYIQYNKACDRF